MNNQLPPQPGMAPPPPPMQPPMAPPMGPPMAGGRSDAAEFAEGYKPEEMQAFPGTSDEAALDVMIDPSMTGDEIAELLEKAQAQVEEQRSRRIDILDRIGTTLEFRKNEAITYRSDFEQEWLADNEQYHEGTVPMLDAKATRAAAAVRAEEPEYRKSRDNITRPAVLMVTSRTSDMLFPTSDRNWDISASPDAQIPRALLAEALAEFSNENGGQPPTQDQIESAEQKFAERRVEAMRKRIDDQLQQSNYSAHGRDAIADAIMYGTGVIKGPVASSRRARVYNEQSQRWERQWKESPDPAAQYTDLFNFYPMPCRRIGEADGAFELHLWSNEKVRALADQPGFDKYQVRRLLKEQPEYGALTGSPLYRAVAASSRGGAISQLLDARYSVWEYHGSLPKEGVVEFVSGLALMGSLDPEEAAAIVQEVEDDPLTNVQCECWMSGGIVLKLTLEPLREGQQVYQVYNYEERPETLFGRSVPSVIREDQVAATQLWQAMMLNSIMSAGLQIGVKKGSLMPAGGDNSAPDLSFTKPRVWCFGDDVEDIEKAMTVFQTPNVLNELMPLYERAKKNAEEHIVLPAIVQGDATQSVQTSSGLAMLMNAGNVVSRRLAKGWDDNVTSHLLTGFYEFNMEYGPEHIKGDFSIIPRGSSHLLVKDVQSQRFLFAMQLYAGTPELEKRMKWPEWGRQGLVIMDMDANQMLFSESEMEAKKKEAQDNPAPPDPQVIRAQAAQAEAENRRQAAEIAERTAMGNADLEREKLAANERTARDKIASSERIEQMRLTIAMAKLDKEERMDLMAFTERQREKGQDLQLSAAEMAQKEKRDRLEISVESPNPRLA